MSTWQRQQSYSIFYLKYPHDFSLNLVKQTTCGHSFYIVHAKKTSSCFMRKIKGLKRFLLMFLEESVFTQWILRSRYEMSRRQMQILLHVFMILPKYNLYYIFYIVWKVHYQHSSRARYLNQMLDATSFISV